MDVVTSSAKSGVVVAGVAMGGVVEASGLAVVVPVVVAVVVAFVTVVSVIQEWQVLAGVVMAMIREMAWMVAMLIRAMVGMYSVICMSMMMVIRATGLMALLFPLSIQHPRGTSEPPLVTSKNGRRRKREGGAAQEEERGGSSSSPEGGGGTPGSTGATPRWKFASDLMHKPLKVLSELGGWKNPQTILICYQNPDQDQLREALKDRRKASNQR